MVVRIIATARTARRSVSRFASSSARKPSSRDQSAVYGSNGSWAWRAIEVLDRVLGRHLGPAKEELPFEEGPVQGTSAQHRSVGDGSPRRRHESDRIVNT